MSFILDALKKAESERGRASGPVLVDVRIAPPRRGLPVWVWLLGAALLANLAVLGWVVLRKPATHDTAANGSTTVSATAPTPSTRANATVPAPQTFVIPPPTLPVNPSPSPILQPAPRPARSATPASAAPPADVDKLPTLQQLQASGVSLPPLRLTMHVYDSAPALRYILLNGVELLEGESTPDGIKVEAITENGVVLEAAGRRFMLPAGG